MKLILLLKSRLSISVKWDPDVAGLMNETFGLCPGPISKWEELLISKWDLEPDPTGLMNGGLRADFNSFWDF